MKAAVAVACLFLGVMFDQWQWDTAMDARDELTVSAFEIEEDGLSVVLTNAIEDQRAVVEYVNGQWEGCERMRDNSVKNDPQKTPLYEKWMTDTSRVLFQSVRVLRLLEATRDREGGKLA